MIVWFDPMPPRKPSIELASMVGCNPLDAGSRHFYWPAELALTTQRVEIDERL